MGRERLRLKESPEKEGYPEVLDPLTKEFGKFINEDLYQRLVPLCRLIYLAEQNGIAEEHAFKLLMLRT